jgi:hypothetical protein
MSLAQKQLKVSNCTASVHCSTIDCLLSSFSSDLTTQKRDAIVFHLANAISSINRTSSFRTSLQQFQSSTSVNFSISISSVVSSSAPLRVELNNAIKSSISSNNIYPKINDDGILSQLNNPSFDVLAAFESKVAQIVTNGTLHLYADDAVGGVDNSQNYWIGTDVITNCNDMALVVKPAVFEVIPATDANSYNGRVLFVGISDIIDPSVEIIDRAGGHSVQWGKPYWHASKIDFIPCETGACDVRYQWQTKGSWFGAWKVRTGGTLTQPGETNYFEYAGYRTKIFTWWGTIPNYSIWQKRNPQDADWILLF